MSPNECYVIRGGKGQESYLWTHLSKGGDWLHGWHVDIRQANIYRDYRAAMDDLHKYEGSEIVEVMPVVMYIPYRRWP